MNKSVSVPLGIITGVIIGSVATLVAYPEISGFFNLSEGPQVTESKSAEKKPLYWVAPMDANYRRNKPGKSPMGMDLVPVYEEEAGGGDDGPGTVKISPDVLNNLGVRTASAELAELHSVIRTVGYVGYDEDQLVHIHPRVKGWVENLHVKAAGDPVKRGQPLYDIYSPELVNAQEELLLAMERKSQRLLRAAELRLRSLRVPGPLIDRLKKNGEVRQNVTFFSPQGGVVDNLVVREGFYVSPGSTIMSIGALDQVWVEAEVFERQSSLVKIGQPVTMTLDYLPGRTWQGNVDYIYPTLDPQTRTVRVRLRFENKDGLLKPNMFTQVVIHSDASAESLLIPKEAVIRTGRDDRVVLALGDGRFKSVEVKVGRYDEDSAEILSGLNEGDEVVTSAQFLIDSESSKTSDFKRMSHDVDVTQPKSVWTKATINSLMVDERKINATHQPISRWEWPEMTMDFDVAETVDLSSLQEGMQLNIEISRAESDRYEITGVHLPDTEDARSLDDLDMGDMSLDDMALE